MTYTGRIQHGVVVLEGNPQLTDGTLVRVEVESDTLPEGAVGSARAILRHAGAWSKIQPEVDQALEDLRQMKQDELRAQPDGSDSTL